MPVEQKAKPICIVQGAPFGSFFMQQMTGGWLTTSFLNVACKRSPVEKANLFKIKCFFIQSSSIEYENEELIHKVGSQSFLHTKLGISQPHHKPAISWHKRKQQSIWEWEHNGWSTFQIMKEGKETQTGIELSTCSPTVLVDVDQNNQAAVGIGSSHTMNPPDSFKSA